MGKKIIRPIKGIDVDSATNRRDDNNIYMAENLRLNSGEDMNMGEYSNIKGPNSCVEYPNGGFLVKLGKVGENVLFFHSTYSNTTGTILLVEESDIPKQGEGTLVLDDSGYYWEGPYHKVISGSFRFSNILDVKTYYESELVQKVYWTTDNQSLMSLNVIHSDYNDPSSFDENDLEIIPTADLAQPEIVDITTGNLLSGKIYYTYTLVNSNGSETNFSELSNAYHLTKSSESLSTDYNYSGSGFDVNTGKGVRLTISEVGPIFSRVKVYSVHLLDDSSSPVIKLIYDDNISESLSLVDTGVALSEISAEEFAGYSSLDIKGGTLAVKNNRLFAANYEEDFFDIDNYATNGYWDARSYRFKGVGATYGNCLLYDSDLTTKKTILAANPDYSTDNIPVDWDCINIDNDLENWTSDLKNNYIYKSDESTLGSSGMNIQITQNSTASRVYVDAEGADVKWNSKKTNSVSLPLPEDGYASYANPKISSKYRSFKPEEVYRLGIQFINSKQQFSYVKWITDFKVAYDNSDLLDASANEFAMKPQYLAFNVSNIPTDPETGKNFGYRIMYVPITTSDRSAYWGLFNPLYKKWFAEASENYFTITKSNENFDGGSNVGKYLDFVSPDYCLGDRQSYSHFQLYKSISPSNVNFKRGFFENSVGYYFNKVYDFTNLTSSLFRDVVQQFDVEYSSDLTGRIPLNGSDLFFRSLIGNRVNSETTDKDDPSIRSNKARSQIIYPNIVDATENDSYFGCSYVNRFTSRYGGISYQSRGSSGYVALNSFSRDSSQVVYGDSYLGAFEYLRMISDNNDSSIVATEARASNPEVIVFPTISSSNLNLRSDKFFSRTYTLKEATLMHEFSGVYENPVVVGDPLIYTQEDDLYLYNNTYSREQNLNEYYEKTGTAFEVENFESRIVASNLKILGETSDSFLKISPSTYIDVDGQYGKIVKLLVFNERLYFFQEKAIGIVAVSERSQTVDSDGNAISMGELGLLSRYDYLTTENGISQYNFAIASNSAIYAIDTVRKVLLRVNQGGVEKISITKHVDSLVRKSNLAGVGRIIFNRGFNEILFPVKIDFKKKMLVFNEIVDGFTGMYTNDAIVEDSVPIDHWDLYDELYLKSASLEAFTLNDGTYNIFYDDEKASEITFLVTSDNDMQVLYNVIEFSARQTDGFLASYRIHNDECDTGTILVDSSTLKEKFGKFRTDKLRNYLGNKERMLSDHIYVTLTTKDEGGLGVARIYFRDLIAKFSEYNYFG